ncbi:NADPH quinone reductase [Lapidilactobacillus dextrinicus DSM 20335]|uniref:NADPH quinone reductase n=1 Tax=Lapidilactobacillus dextrinicus DSM 20335 TaxID=1423738 RepID=A0A0R2BHH6_9LACO|nr:zinc-binding dehydrogenase [Lapidilactobacillus dextrinicus]KRM78727.1 NADPH quinone reductase [Lapidilactobacillus dextrinicus DSM 20335]QFG47451.1 zinc-binding dehydrogenase [Lapidilactobacillus dextrinicus]
MTEKNLAFVALGGQELTAKDSFAIAQSDIPNPKANDLIVKVEGFSLNPIDEKRRSSLVGQSLILGYDAVGEIVALGDQVQNLTIGDRVIYAGTTKRAGSYQRYQAVAANLIAKVDQEAPLHELAALPLVGLTAWELLFERLGFTPAHNANQGKTLLVINGAGGVGSMLTQLANWAGLTVLATASPKNNPWLADHGVNFAIDYHTDIVKAVHQSGFNQLDAIAALYNPVPYMTTMAELIAPFGHIGTIVKPTAPLDLSPLLAKSVSFSFERMFTKTDYNLHADSTSVILSKLLALYFSGQLSASVSTSLSPINLTNLKTGLTTLNSGHQVGKIVLSGAFESSLNS